MQPAVLAVSLAFPIAQKTWPFKWDCICVGQVGQIHNFEFSSVSETGLPKNYTIKIFCLKPNNCCDCFYSTTDPNSAFNLDTRVYTKTNLSM